MKKLLFISILSVAFLLESCATGVESTQQITDNCKLYQINDGNGSYVYSTICDNGNTSTKFRKGKVYKTVDTTNE